MFKGYNYDFLSNVVNGLISFKFVQELVTGALIVVSAVLYERNDMSKIDGTVLARPMTVPGPANALGASLCKVQGSHDPSDVTP